jgi:hypothetical protein
MKFKLLLIAILIGASVQVYEKFFVGSHNGASTAHPIQATSDNPPIAEKGSNLPLSLLPSRQQENPQITSR